MELTKKITTPLGKNEVEIKIILTGAEREKIDNAQMQYMKTSDGKSFEVTDMSKVALAQKHELLKTCLISIDGDKLNCFDRIQKFYEQDYDFVFDEIMKEQKKNSKRPLDIQTL
ncbi:MAG: hypothetical protein KAS07_02865 [Candidatus Pacebacteria bacterium]|nr:hypothetical protein [Candidatus Paceibacterota bacterium]